MKSKKLAFAAVAAATLVLGACGNNGSNDSAKGSDEIVTEVPKDTTVTFWHAMNGAQEEALTKLTDEFMEANPNVKVELQNQSQYSDLQAKINSTLPSPKDLPTITQAYPGWLWNAAQDEMLVDLGEYIDNDTIGWGDQEEIRSSLLEGAQDGVFIEPGSAASLAGVIQHVKNGKIRPGETVVAVFTGNGLKDPDTAIQATEVAIHKMSDLEEMRQHLRKGVSQL